MQHLARAIGHGTRSSFQLLGCRMAYGRLQNQITEVDSDFEWFLAVPTTLADIVTGLELDNRGRFLRSKPQK